LPRLPAGLPIRIRRRPNLRRPPPARAFRPGTPPLRPIQGSCGPCPSPHDGRRAALVPPAHAAGRPAPRVRRLAPAGARPWSPMDRRP